MARLNKKILCFVDEYGQAGEAGFALGCVMIWARECGKVDKAFSDLLPSTVNEVHATEWDNKSLKGLLDRFSRTPVSDNLLMLNKRIQSAAGNRPILYANALVETVKICVRRFAKSRYDGKPVGNVEVIVDANELNTHPDFQHVIDGARNDDGRFKAVKRVVSLDSSAARLLQLADIVAHSRAWIDHKEINAETLRNAYCIETL